MANPPINPKTGKDFITELIEAGHAEPPAAAEPSERDRDLASKIRQHPATPYCVAEEIARHLAPERQQHAAEVERLTAENANLRAKLVELQADYTDLKADRVK